MIGLTSALRVLQVGRNHTSKPVHLFPATCICLTSGWVKSPGVLGVIYASSCFSDSVSDCLFLHLHMSLSLSLPVATRSFWGFSGPFDGHSLFLSLSWSQWGHGHK